MHPSGTGLYHLCCNQDQLLHPRLFRVTTTRYISRCQSGFHYRMLLASSSAAARHRLLRSVFLASLLYTAVVCQPFPTPVDVSTGTEKHEVCTAIAEAGERDPNAVGSARTISWSQPTLDNGGYICLAQAPHFSPLPANGTIATWTSRLAGVDFANQALCTANCPLQSASSFSSFVTTAVTVTPQNQNQFTVRWGCYDKTAYDARVTSCSEQLFEAAFASLFANLLNNGFQGTPTAAASSVFRSDSNHSATMVVALCLGVLMACATWHA